MMIFLIVKIFIIIITSKITKLIMSRYIHKFDTVTEYTTARNNNYLEPWVSYTEENTKVDYNKEKWPFGLLETPLTFEITGGGNIVWNARNTALTKTIEYSKDNGATWTSITSNTGSSVPSISVVSGDTLQFRGNNTTYGTSSYYNTFSGSTAQFKVKGNIMSLINSTNFSGLTTFESDYTFYILFAACTGLTDASKLLLPATTLTESCYNGMFQDCTSLTTAPQLPATTLAKICYSSMFYGCTSLTTAPELPATTLANYCYSSMFQGCTNLNYIKCLATDISASDYTMYWVQGVQTSTGTFVTPSTTDWSSKTGTSGIPNGWTRVDA